MVERMLITSCVLFGWFHLVPLVLLPRRLVTVRAWGMGAGVLVRPSSHWAVAIGLALRMTQQQQFPLWGSR